MLKNDFTHMFFIYTTFQLPRRRGHPVGRIGRKLGFPTTSKALSFLFKKSSKSAMHIKMSILMFPIYL